MYAKFFGLEHEPFSIAPDPRFLFMSERHREALAHLVYGLGAGGGFVLLTGEIGAGKTTVSRCFLKQIPRRCNVAYIFNPQLTVSELLQSVCDELHIPYRQPESGAATVKDYLDPLNEFLVATHGVGQNNVLIIDEAQRLSGEVLEQLRLLTNLETNERKLLQIILIGQPELRELLGRPELQQLEQRIIARFHLDALSQDETAQYIAHRLAVAGLTGVNPFERKAMARIHALTRGVPRRINLLCDRALLGAYTHGAAHVDRAVVDTAANEVFGTGQRSDDARSLRQRIPAWGWLGLGVVAGAALWGGVTVALQRGSTQPVRAVAAVSAAKVAAVSSALPAAAASVAMSVAASVAASGAASTAASSAASAGAAAAAAAAPASAASAPAPIKATLAEMLAAAWTSEPQAWRQLAASWKLPVADGDPCHVPERQAVRCFRSDAGLPLIRRLGRPAVLTLRDAKGRPAYVLLTGLGEQAATMGVGERIYTAPLPALAKSWRGEFATLWRAPPGYRTLVTEGFTGLEVDWLAARLASLQGQPPPPAARPFDEALKTRLRAFQSAQGLIDDGIAGPTTFMQINRVTGVEEPRLATVATLR